MSNFFDDPLFQENLHRIANAARSHAESISPPTSVSSGDSFVFTESIDLPVRWVATQRHKDNAGIWYLLAADEFPMVGSCDVEQPETTAVDSLIVRCTVGFWAHEKDIPRERYVGKIDSEVVADCRDRLAEMVRGGVPMTEHGVFADVDGDYRNWISELSEVAERIESRIQSEPIVLKVAAPDTTWAADTRISDYRQQRNLALAADASGEHQESVIPAGCILESALPGVLVLRCDGDDFDLVYFPKDENDSPPTVDTGVREQNEVGRWARGSDGVLTWSRNLKATSGHLCFAVGSNNFDIELPANE